MREDEIRRIKGIIEEQTGAKEQELGELKGEMSD